MKRKICVFVLIFLIGLSMCLCNKSYAGYLSSDINGIDESRYPGIKSSIQSMQAQHPRFHFQVYYTGIDWTEAITMEYQGHLNSPKNLVSKKTGGSASTNRCGKWFCAICGENKFDSGLYCASKDSIAYMMDPRNSLGNVSDIYQFKNLEYSDNVSYAQLQAVISTKYGSYSYVNNPTTINAIINAGNSVNLNIFSILAKIINEQGTGSSALIRGEGYNGNYVGYYNFFNIGAYGNGTANIINNGLRYAQNKGWNSVETSILGGSSIYKNSYIGKGQNTLYYQKYNVVNETSLFSHQYQQDIMGAETSSILMKSYYDIAGMTDSVDQFFIIPVYENMPTYKSPRPSTTENNYLEYEEVTIKFEGLPVYASPNSTRIIAYLNANEKVKVLEKATYTARENKYWDAIITETDGTYGYIDRDGINGINVPNYIFDANYYANNNLDVKAVYGNNSIMLYQHFLTYGISEGRASSHTFSVSYYLNNNADLLSVYGQNNYIGAYNHFINYGCNEFRKTSPEYDGTFYRCYYSFLIGLSPIDLMYNYLNYGISSNLIGGIDSSLEKLLFDVDVYYNCNPDLKNAIGYNQAKLMEHWLLYGIAEGRYSSLVFNTVDYGSLNADLYGVYGTNNRNLFEHYVRYGKNENRNASIVFSLNYYLNNNSDILNAYGFNNSYAVYCHFIDNGCKEYRKSSRDYDGNAYRTRYSKVSGLSSVDLIYYYLLEGRKVGDIATNDLYELDGADKLAISKYIFNPSYYYYTNTDLRIALGKNVDMLYYHFINYGCAEGRSGSAVFNPKYYLENNDDLVTVLGENNYEAACNHFNYYGCSEFRRSSPEYDGNYYRSTKPEFATMSGIDLINYYINIGRSNGEKAIE